MEAQGQPTIRSWALSTIRDRAGNRIEFTYSEDTTNGGSRSHASTAPPIPALPSLRRIAWSSSTRRNPWAKSNGLCRGAP